MPRLCVIHGDGIGQEVIPAALEVLSVLIPDLDIVEAQAGWGTFLERGVSVPEETLTTLKDCGAGLFGAVSSPSHSVQGYRSAILTMRQSLNLYANIRPIRFWPGISPREDVDMIIVRENTEGLYSGRERIENGVAIAERVISREASRRIAARALDVARLLGRKRLTIVHKANVLPLTDGLFRDCVLEVAEEFEQDGFSIEIDQLLVDVAALKMLAEPICFDMIVTTNLFGDILSDAGAYWGGGLGLAPSLNWGEDVALAEPVHGSAPDIAGKGMANPMAALLSAALLARYVWNQPETADRIENAVGAVLQDNPGILSQGTQQITNVILSSLDK